MAASTTINRVVKVQRPIYTTDSDSPWLVYAKGRQHIQQIPEADIPNLVKSHMGDRTKAYFDATWSPETGWQFTGPMVKDRNW